MLIVLSGRVLASSKNDPIIRETHLYGKIKMDRFDRGDTHYSSEIYNEAAHMRYEK
jgi:hypothetical protein